MKKNLFKKLNLVVITGCLSMMMNTSHAAVPNIFSNGAVADADDVNQNFTHLDDRITNISLTPGPTGPAGPQGLPGVNGQNGLNGLDGQDGATGPAGTTGPQGPAGTDGTDGTNGINGTDGVGIVIQSAAGFDSSAYTEKVFIVTGSQGRWDKEVRSFNRVDNGDGTITNNVTRQRTAAGAIIRHDVLKYISNTNGNTYFAERKSYDANAIASLLVTTSISPPIELRNSAMGVGMRWGSASQVTQVFEDATPSSITHAIDSRSLLSVEDITLSSGASYSGCLKIETIRTSQVLSVGQYQEISWHCPNNVGLVKSIMVRDSGSVTSRVRELDVTQSTPSGVF